MKCETLTSSLNPLLRVLDALVAVYIVAAGVHTASWLWFFSVIMGIMLILVGVLLFINALWAFATIEAYARGLRTYGGVGAAWIFFACLTIGGNDWRYGCSIVVFILGLLYIIISFAAPGVTPQPLLGSLAFSWNCCRRGGGGASTASSTPSGTGPKHSGGAVAPVAA
jgi:hypothetical protein